LSCKAGGVRVFTLFCHDPPFLGEEAIGETGGVETPEEEYARGDKPVGGIIISKLLNGD
jgi:hypothetical protein